MGVFDEKMKFIISSSLPDSFKLVKIDFDKEFNSNLYFVFTTVEVLEDPVDLQNIIAILVNLEKAIDETLSTYLFNNEGKFIEVNNLQLYVETFVSRIDYLIDEKFFIDLQTQVHWYEKNT